ncbi:MAG: DUF4167 domain-containing protein [Rhodobacteraceae bacterium]|nr:DUF4167 domain-containing protein [Paracoccaceae bacterium]
MRQSNKRSRSKNNRPRSLGNIVNRVFDSSGPEGKVRGTPQQIIDKYTLLARDAQLSGDRVAAENFQQHAEHYTRMLNEAQAELAREAEQRREQQGSQNGGQQNARRDDQGESGDGDGQNQNRQEWKDRRNKRNDDRRNRRDQGDPRDAAQSDADQGAAMPGEIGQDRGSDSESMLVETPESRSDRQPAGGRAAAAVEAPVEAPAQASAQAPGADAVATDAVADEAPKPRKRTRKPKADSAEKPADTAPSDAAE